MRSSGSRLARAVAAIAGVALAAAAAWLLTGGHRALRPLLEGPEAGARRALAELSGRVPLDLPAAGLTARVDRLRLRDPLVTVDVGGSLAAVVADADAAASWRGTPVLVGYVGLERLRVVRGPAGWRVEGSPLPRLGALLSTLARRAEAFDGADAEGYRALVDDGYGGAEGGKAALLRRLAGDLAARPRARFRPIAWQVRIERETAQVGEDFEIAVGEAAPRRLRARLDLREGGGRWRFTGGL